MKLGIAFISFGLGMFVGLIWADVINVIILKTIPTRKPRETQPDPYADGPWGDL